MSAPLKISFVVPVYQAENVRAYFDACIQSLTDQTYPHTEIILVAGLPSAQTAQIIHDLASQHTQIQAITHTQSQRQGPSRNIGAEVATGDYIWFVDQDDLVAPNACQILADEAQACGLPDIIRFDYSKNSEKFAPQPSGPSQLIRYEDYDKDKRYRSRIDCCLLNCYRTNGQPWRQIIKAQLACSFQFPDAFPEDIVYTLGVLAQANSILYLPAKLYFWRDHSLNATGEHQAERAIVHIKALELMREIAQQFSHRKVLRKFLRCHNLYWTRRCLRYVVKDLNCKDASTIQHLRRLSPNTWRANIRLARDVFCCEVYALHCQLRAPQTTPFSPIRYGFRMVRKIAKLKFATVPALIMFNACPVFVQKIKHYPKQ